MKRISAFKLIMFLISALLLIGIAVAQSIPQSSNSCTLGGAYTSNWLGINFIVILLGFTVIGIVYAASRFLGPRISGMVTELSKVEITQLAISAIIIMVLLSTSLSVCSLSSSVSGSLIGQPNLNPFQYSEYYMESISINTGLGLLSYIYTTGISYAIYGAAVRDLGIPFGQDLYIFYDTLSAVYIGIFSELLIIIIGILFLQWLSLPVIQTMAFTLFLPFALIIRSISFAGAGNPGLREAGNAILALAIAFYIVYPMMIVMNSYVISYAFSPKNPLYSCQNCLSSELVPLTVPKSFFSSLSSYSYTGSFLGGFISPPVSSFISGPLFQNIGLILPNESFNEAQAITSGIAKYIFMGLFMLGIDLTVTIGFASSLSKALNAGLDSVNFWGNL